MRVIERCAQHGLRSCSVCEPAIITQTIDSGFKEVELPTCKHGFTNCSVCGIADMVNQPSHYNYGEIECIDAIKGMLGEEGFKAYCRGNAMKYTWRAGLKFDEVEDLKKASWYNRIAAGDDPRED